MNALEQDAEDDGGGSATFTQAEEDSRSIQFHRAKRSVRWHYQWIVLNDILPQLADPDVLDDIKSNGRRFYDFDRAPFDGEPFMPLEFSGAAYRFGHSMIRDTYNFNRVRMCEKTTRVSRSEDGAASRKASPRDDRGCQRTVTCRGAVGGASQTPQQSVGPHGPSGFRWGPEEEADRLAREAVHEVRDDISGEREASETDEEKLPPPTSEEIKEWEHRREERPQREGYYQPR